MVINWDLQEAVWHEIETLRDADRVPVGNNDVETELIQNYYAQVQARDHGFESDEPATLAGGKDRGPRPLEYFLAGFAFCQEVIYAKNALAMGIDIDDISIDVNGDVDLRGVFTDDASPGFVDDTIEYTTYIDSPAPRAKLAELVAQAEHHCPAHDALRNPMGFDRTVLVNGEPLD
jgi:uncharacterized OsmC-like protein